MYAKIQITGNLEVVTGMHIGGSSAFSAIGAVDSPVVKDVRTNLPMIPGSSLKGKIRTLLSKEYNESVAAKPEDDCERIVRIFGSAKKDNIKSSRVTISDMFMSNREELKNQGLQSMTEVKFENSINRATGVANPRQIERTVRGTVFAVDIMYEVTENNSEQVEEDIETLTEGLRLLQYDYLGGNGSRGYGKVAFHELKANCVIGSLPADVMDKCNQVLKNVSKD